MSAISALLGRALHLADEALPAALHSDVPWDDYAAVALLLFFGIRTRASAGGADEAAEEERVISLQKLNYGQCPLLAIECCKPSTHNKLFVETWGVRLSCQIRGIDAHS